MFEVAIKDIATPQWQATLTSDQIRRIERIASAISTEETRYYLNGIALRHVEGWTYRFAATDGHRLMVQDIQLPDATGELIGEIIPRNRWFNIYLHDIRTSDDDRALHDHPWLNCSIILAGGYFEHTIAAGGVESRTWRGTGMIALRRSVAAHRLEVVPGVGALTLFITGPRIRSWGFHCPQAGWRHWEEFTAVGDSSKTGRGCE